MDFGDFARIENDMGYEVQNLFKLLRGNIRHKADTRRNAAEIPDVRYGRRKFDMSHTFATDFRFRYFDAALFAAVSATCGRGFSSGCSRGFR